MSGFKRDKKEEEGSFNNPFQNLDKTSVLQEARYFNETPVNHRKCTLILAKVLHLLNQGEKLTTQEATDVFFAITKLFQSKDLVLRRMVYLCIKELSSMADDVIIVTSSLTKDMTGKEDLYRAAAIRALCSITDATMLQAIERYMKQAIVDRNPSVSSAALVSALHLAPTSPELVKRWATEAQEAIHSDNSMVSYHALGLSVAARKNDRLATLKLVSRLSSSPLKSPLAQCMLIRLAAKLAREDPDNSDGHIKMIKMCLTHRSEMVAYEAARALVDLCSEARDLASTVSTLQIFCGSSKAPMRLAGARTLARLTARHPTAVNACALDLENLITDTNRSVATLAVTTLLATGAEGSVDRLMKQISSFVSEIPDEFKIIVVRAIKRLCQKYPRKHQALAGFLAGMLRDEGGLEYKAAIADAIISLVEENGDAKETGLAHLCEFIEDCEHTSLAVRILHLLGKEGPKARTPSRYVRFVYNRVILESGPVRAAAVSAVAQFGASRPELLPNIRVLLARCATDADDEVRDRALLYGAILDTGDRQLMEDYIISPRKPSAAALERALRDHISCNADVPFNLAAVSETEPEQELKQESIVTSSRVERDPMEELSSLKGAERLGPLFKTSEPVDLTEPETEYRVRCTKHVFPNNLVLQFECENTLGEQILENTKVKIEPADGYDILYEQGIESLQYEKPASAFIVLKYPEDASECVGTFAATLEFRVRDCDPTTGIPVPGDGYEDSYPLEEFEVTLADFVRLREPPSSVGFDAAWESCNEYMEDTFALREPNVTAAASALCKHLGIIQSNPKPDEETSGIAEVKAMGVYREGSPLCVRARLVATPTALTMRLVVASNSQAVTSMILSAVG